MAPQTPEKWKLQNGQKYCDIFFPTSFNGSFTTNHQQYFSERIYTYTELLDGLSGFGASENRKFGERLLISRASRM